MPKRSPFALALLTALAAPPLASATIAPPSSYQNVAGPTALVSSAGEPSIGYNPKTDKVFYQSNTKTLRVDFGPATPTWTDVTEPTATTTLDPILYTDRTTGRTFSSQLLAACSKASYTDDDGKSYTPSQGCGVGTAFDHQTIGGGPFAPGGPGATPGTGYPNAIYYCAQASAAASCAVSRDGGQTFGAAVPVYTMNDCPQGLHGHIKVAPDGTAYLPVFDCSGGKQAVVVSKDNGTSWSIDAIPGTTTQDESDPHVGIGSKGTVYFGYQGADGVDLGNKGYAGNARSEGHALVVVKEAGTSTWSAPYDVGAQLGVKNIQFPELIAGDDDRAAYAFLGTTTAGDDQDPAFNGVWHLYVATTIDGGASWTTVDTTPTDPVQRGCVWLQGGSSKCRNLLDFNDITMDKAGRVLVAYADGCTGACVTDPTVTTKTKLGTIARQVDGPLLLATPGLAAVAPTGETSTTGPFGAPAPKPASTSPSPAATAAAQQPKTARTRARLLLGAVRRTRSGVRVTLRSTSGTLPAVTVRLFAGSRLVAVGRSGRVGRAARAVTLTVRRPSDLRPGTYRLVARATNGRGARAGRSVRLR
jgi:hypothetical protein